VLSPARAPVFLASGGRCGLGCKGDRGSQSGLYRIGSSLSRVGFPGGDGEAVVPASPWNKFLRPCPRLEGACSGVDERSVRVEVPRSGDFVGIESSPNLGGPWPLYRRLLRGVSARYGACAAGLLQRDGWWACGSAASGPVFLLRCSSATCAGPWSEKHGMLHGFFVPVL
jgi:hypothetical protein